jgi:predicted 3-demethylubiquinone-9 3-methyltransferase (glyoxalase superfamily)
MNDLYPCLWFDNQAEEGGGRRGDPELRLVAGQVWSLSWQIVQTALQELMRDSNRVMKPCSRWANSTCKT